MLIGNVNPKDKFSPMLLADKRGCIEGLVKPVGEERVVSTLVTKGMMTGTMFAISAYHLCNNLSHLSQFGSMLDISVQDREMALTVGGLTLSFGSGNVIRKPVKVTSLDIYRFINVIRLVLRFAGKGSDAVKLSCSKDVPGVVITYEGAARMTFLLKTSKLKA